MCNFLEYKGESIFHASSILPSKSGDAHSSGRNAVEWGQELMDRHKSHIQTLRLVILHLRSLTRG